MWPVSPEWSEAVNTSHAVVTRADIYLGGVLRKEGVPVVDATVRVDRKSKVRRTCSVTLATDVRVDSMESLYIPDGSEIVLYRGIDFGTHEELVPVGTFRIDTLTITQPGETIQLQGSDRAVMVQDDRFLAPESAQAATVKGEIIRLVQNSVAGGVTVVDETTTDLAMWTDAVWEQERWDAIEKLADAINADVFFDPIGRLEIRPVPTESDAPVRVITAEKVITSTTVVLSRLGTYNAVVVTGDQAGEVDYRAEAKDERPTSVTRWDGPFGHRPKFYSSTFITSNADAASTAQAMLRAETALPRQLTFSMVPDPALEVGDVVEIQFTNGVTERHMLDSIEFGLSPSSEMRIVTRSLTSLGGAWPTFNDATGGTVTEIDNYLGSGEKWRVHRLVNGDTFTVSAAHVPFRVLLCGGGGGSGGNVNGRTGGSGGGGAVIDEDVTLTVGSYPVTVGQGGAAGNEHGHHSNSPGGTTTLGPKSVGGGGEGGTYHDGNAGRAGGPPNGGHGGNYEDYGGGSSYGNPNLVSNITGTNVTYGVGGWWVDGNGGGSMGGTVGQGGHSHRGGIGDVGGPGTAIVAYRIG